MKKLCKKTKKRINSIQIYTKLLSNSNISNRFIDNRLKTQRKLIINLKLKIRNHNSAKALNKLVLMMERSKYREIFIT
jgi:hypothetical protein